MLIINNVSVASSLSFTGCSNDSILHQNKTNWTENKIYICFPLYRSSLSWNDSEQETEQVNDRKPEWQEWHLLELNKSILLLINPDCSPLLYLTHNLTKIKYITILFLSPIRIQTTQFSLYLQYYLGHVPQYRLWNHSKLTSSTSTVWILSPCI